MTSASLLINFSPTGRDDEYMPVDRGRALTALLLREANAVSVNRVASRLALSAHADPDQVVQEIDDEEVRDHQPIYEVTTTFQPAMVFEFRADSHQTDSCRFGQDIYYTEEPSALRVPSLLPLVRPGDQSNGIYPNRL